MSLNDHLSSHIVTNAVKQPT